MIRAADITDGLAVTWLVGERRISTLVYFSAAFARYPDEDAAALIGHYSDITSTAAGYPDPQCDNESPSIYFFGSAIQAGSTWPFAMGLSA